MAPQTDNGRLAHVVAACRGVRGCCDGYLAWLSRPERRHGGELPETIRCIALFALIGDRLADGRSCPIGLIDEAVRSARALGADEFGCADGCAAAADALADWVDGRYERG